MTQKTSNPRPKKKINKHKKKKQRFDDYIKYSSIAIQMAIIIFGGVFGGFKLDASIKWKFPVFTVTLSLLSVAVAIYIALKDFINFK